MPNIWDNCVKIHSACGGICRWVEAIDRPNVGYHGECTWCEDTEIPTEHMVPVQGVTHDEMKQVDREKRRELSYDEDASWEKNQERLRGEVNKL
jgi:hypothetical protein